MSLVYKNMATVIITVSHVTSSQIIKWDYHKSSSSTLELVICETMVAPLALQGHSIYVNSIYLYTYLYIVIIILIYLYTCDM